MLHSPTAGRLLVPLIVSAALSWPVQAQLPASKLGPLLQARLSDPAGRARVIVRAVDEASFPLLAQVIAQGGGILLQPLPIIDAYAAEVPHASLPLIAD